MYQPDLFQNARNAFACWTCKNRMLNLMLSFPLVSFVCFGAGLWAASTIRWTYSGEVTMVLLFPFGLAGIWLSAFRSSPHASGLSISPSYQINGSQAQLHLGALDNPFAIRTQLRRAIPLELRLMDGHGLRYVSMDSPLLASGRTRRRLVDEFNALFGKEGLRWRAVDTGSRPSSWESFFFVLSYYKACYLQESHPGLHQLLGAGTGSEDRSNTWRKLERDAQGRLLWGGIAFKATD